MEEFYSDFLKWLGDDGIKFFKHILEKYSKVDAIWMEEGNIPHIVHFREGMQVRNKMRSSGYFENYTDHDFDNNWAKIIVEAIRLYDRKQAGL